MKKLLAFLLLAFLIVGCKSKKTKLGDEDMVNISDFIDFFPEVKLPFRLADTSLTGKKTDSSLIGYKIFSQFVPDTVLAKQFGKKAKPNLYPLGKSVIKKYETYLFVKAVTPSKKAAYVLVFDKDRQFVAAKPLLVTDNDPSTSYTAEVDSKYTITTLRQKKVANAQLKYTKNAYIFSSGVFMLILTESNEKANTASAVINPLDTFPRKNKFSGDYVIDQKNFVSVRDGRREGTMLFFIHFEKDKGTCSGELKGEAVFSGSTKAIFHQSNGPCVVEFNFSGSRVSIKETGPCGTYRDIKCFFEGSFLKKKVPRSKKPIKK